MFSRNISNFSDYMSKIFFYKDLLCFVNNFYFFIIYFKIIKPKNYKALKFNALLMLLKVF